MAMPLLHCHQNQQLYQRCLGTGQQAALAYLLPGYPYGSTSQQATSSHHLCKFPGWPAVHAINGGVDALLAIGRGMNESSMILNGHVTNSQIAATITTVLTLSRDES